MLTLNSYAKLNLYLEVLKKRKDKYHNLKTVFERIGLADKIILKSRRDKKINITCNVASVPQDNSNLAWRSAKLLQDSFNIDKGVDIKIIKRIPVGSGLGGGSSNAATVLAGLNKLWKLNITQSKLARLGEKLGCDVPFFIYNSPFAQGQARGDKIKPLKALANVRLWHILVVPKIGVSTASIYNKWDEYFKAFKLTPHLWTYSKTIKNEYNKGAGLTRPNYNVKILILALKKKNLSLIGDALFNSLEQVTARLYPQINAIKERLRQLGAKSILMSGSGPAVMAIVSSRKEALSLSRQLKTNSSFGEVFVIRTH
ncbi:MAG: 4-(cytidine 5'-diphospho)-2-C-methyl-D-erythritol kinase [Candidatus Omnitrophota bacterium]|nr:4-(cytidine 5'-diphospho)-2-C-methyl-D-erythritol kinase [Candidatus Omnitrophota bacterium]